MDTMSFYCILYIAVFNEMIKKKYSYIRFQLGCFHRRDDQNTKKKFSIEIHLLDIYQMATKYNISNNDSKNKLYDSLTIFVIDITIVSKLCCLLCVYAYERMLLN